MDKYISSCEEQALIALGYNVSVEQLRNAYEEYNDNCAQDGCINEMQCYDDFLVDYVASIM